MQCLLQQKSNYYYYYYYYYYFKHHEETEYRITDRQLVMLVTFLCERFDVQCVVCVYY